MLSLMEVYSMTDTTPLSPAAQAVLDALHTENSTGPERYWARANAVAALRAAADLVAPDDYKCYTGNLEWDAGMEARTDDIRENLLTIAAELEGAQ
jgi:hypothetical protein